MKASVNAVLRQLGAAGVLLGIGLLLACAGFWASARSSRRSTSLPQRAVVERLNSRAPYQPVTGGGREDRLRRYQACSRPAAGLTAELERLHRLARGAARCRQGEYRLERRPTGGSGPTV